MPIINFTFTPTRIISNLEILKNFSVSEFLYPLKMSRLVNGEITGGTATPDAIFVVSKLDGIGHNL